MEDALISPEGFMILSGAGLVDATSEKPIYQHMTETVDLSGIQFYSDEDATATTDNIEEAKSFSVKISEVPYLPVDKYDNFAYVMLIKNGEIISEPYIPEHEKAPIAQADGSYIMKIKKLEKVYTEQLADEETHDYKFNPADSALPVFDSVMVDYYVARKSGARQIEITADKFGGNYYLEASTLFRDQNGVDMPAEFIIPNCKIQSNFTFTMASSGDPSSFTFTMDAFPDYTKFDKSKKVLASIQIIEEAGSQDLHRHSTKHEDAHDLKF